MPPPPRPRGDYFPGAGTPTDPMNISDSGSDADTTVPSAASTPHARSGVTQDFAQNMLDDLSSSLRGYQASANYCCGGSVPIEPFPGPGLPKIVLPGQVTAHPMVLRFDTPSGFISKVQFPLEDGDAGLGVLLDACSPATFGSGGKDVLDETYRKAGKLDRTNFSVDFHPHDYGIIDTIAQTLLPGINRPISDESLELREEHWGVRAELYKLNVSPDRKLLLAMKDY